MIAMKKSIDPMKTARGAAMLSRLLVSERGISLVVVIMVMVIILAITAAGLLFSSMDLRITSNFRAGTQAFYAADTGVSMGVSQLALDPAVSTAPFFGNLAGGLAYRSGPRNATSPQPSQLFAIRNIDTYNIAEGTGYIQQGFSAYQYQMSVTGTGPLAAAREIQAQTEFSPVPR
jgi:hypothetical protein